MLQCRSISHTGMYIVCGKRRVAGDDGIDRHAFRQIIEHRSLYYAHQFRLRILNLVMQARPLQMAGST